MLNIVLMRKGMTIVPGIPKYFLKDSDLLRLLRDAKLTESFIDRFGEGVTVGRLGIKCSDGSYCEDEQDIDVSDTLNNGDLGYYAKI